VGSDLAAAWSLGSVQAGQPRAGSRGAPCLAITSGLLQPLRQAPLARRQRLEVGHIAGGAHHTLEHAETRHNTMAAELRLIVKAEPLGRLHDAVARRMLWRIELTRLGRSPAAGAGASGRR
jgi:hypothetical protein